MAAKTKGTLAAPVFVTSAGDELHLRPVPALLVSHMLLLWDKANPMPVPPRREGNIANQAVSMPDDQNEYFQQQMDLWKSERGQHQLWLYFFHGVANTVPKDWEYREHFEGVSPIQFKAAWIESILIDPSDIDRLAEAIASLSDPTPEGLKDAEKNSE